MTLHPNPIIYCLVDIEPRSFNVDDDAETTFSFAVNLSLECPSDSELNAATEELARDTFQWFLEAVQNVRFRLYGFQVAGNFLTEIPKPFDVVSEGSAGDPADLFNWLDQENPNPDPHNPEWRYWTTQAGQWAPDKAQEAESAGAAQRLRAAQSWNAPVAHRFKLTHILRIPSDVVGGLELLVLPFFGADEPPQPQMLGHIDQNPGNLPTEDWAFDIHYDPLGGIPHAVCRTNWLGEGITTRFLPSDIDTEVLDRDGYFVVDEDADNVRRFLTRFEERSASLIAPHQAFGARQAGDDIDYASLFEFSVTKESDDNYWLSAPGAAWMVTTSLLSMLDNIALGFLKPIKGPASTPTPDNRSEGEILAPLVSCFIGQLEEYAKRSSGALGDALAETAGDTARITGCIRTVLMESPLLNRTKGANLTRLSLRHVFSVAVADAPESDQLIDRLLDSYTTGSWEKQKVDKRLADYIVKVHDEEMEVEVLTNALLGAAQKLQEESGAERAIMRFVETASIVLRDGAADFSYERLAQSIAGALEPGADAELVETIAAAFIDAWLAYRTLLDGPFNGAEAARRAAGNTFMRTVLRFEQEVITVKPGTRSARLATAVAGSNYYLARLLDERLGTCFEPLTAFLVTPECPFPTSSKNTIREHLRKVYEETVAETVNTTIAPANMARFIPDSAPQPLTIQVGSGIDPEKANLFGKRLNGIGVAIRRIDDDGGNWAHANLADLRWGSPAGETKEKPLQVEAAIHPMLPAITDGRSPMFIEYEGFPFADPAFAERFADEDADGRQTARRAFYDHDPHVSKTLGFASTPRLAYGRRFDFFAFVTSNAGTLPLKLQDNHIPWMPISDLKQPKPSSELGSMAYRRRTAIAQMAMEEKLQPGEVGRIGGMIEGVYPLATDYPRIGLMAEHGMPGTRDMLRELDSVGGIHIPALGEPHGAGLKWTLVDLAWVGEPSKLTFRLFDRPSNGPLDGGKMEIALSAATTDLKALTQLTLQIRQIEPPEGSGVPWIRVIELLTGDKVLVTVFLDYPDRMTAWLRIMLETDAKNPAAVSFADFSAQKPDGVGAPLLLLAPRESKVPNVWKDSVPGEAWVRISSPRIGYLDFERWMANSELRSRTYKVGTDDIPTKLFERALLAAYVMRHLNPKLARHLDNLPDPAVSGIRVELAIQDTLDGSDHAAASHTLYLEDALKEFIGSLDLPEKTRTLKDEYNNRLAPGQSKLGEDDPTPWTPLKLCRMIFEPLNQAFQFDVRIAVGDFELADKTDPLVHLLARLPGATVARLSLDALVPINHFIAMGLHPSAFDERLLQYASRWSSKDDVAFPASALLIETMFNGMARIERDAIRLAADMIEAVPINSARRYDLMTAGGIKPTDRNHWRLLGEIDTTTQLWRPTGRPIYHFVKPHDHAAKPLGGESNAPALPLVLGADDRALPLFEREAFFDRPDIDAYSSTQTLAPLPARTVLAQHSWDAPSATYFRHRFTLRTRYAGALKNLSDRVLTAWPKEDKPTPAAWTMRVAMLADLSRILLTRPQLRALIPLTTAPGGEDRERPAPPVAAILQERPFSRGGLADRIAGEIQTGFGYGFAMTESSSPAHPVEVMDSRKQFGPSPELDYRPTPMATALGMTLRTEGPIGLTFDAIDVAAPAFANTMLSLRPTTLFGEDPPLEEVFAGVAMRRYIDPDWSTGLMVSKGSSERTLRLDAERSWWIDAEQGKMEIRYEADGESTPLIRVMFDNRWVDVWASKLAIDGIAGANETEVPILLVDRKRIKSLSILHQPIAAGRYSICIFANQTAAKTSRGQGDAPLVLASFEWSPHKIKESDKRAPSRVALMVENAEDAYLSARETIASAPTALSWVRTNRDFNYVNVARPKVALDVDRELVIEQHHVRHLTAKLDAAHKSISFDLSSSVNNVWLASSTLRNPYPVHVHRHLALITTRYLKEMGNPVEIFCRTAMTGPEGWVLIDQEDQDGGNTSEPGKLYPPEQHVRVVEFETPAAILCAKDVSAPLAYRSAYVDLFSTGFSQGQELRLVLRFVGSADHLRSFTSLVLNLSQPGMPGVDNYKPLEIPIKLMNTADKFAVGLNLVLRPKERRSLTGWLTYSDGTRVSPKLIWSEDAWLNLDDAATQDRPGFHFDVTAEGGGEFWADMSVLHGAPSKTTSGVALNFEWLFSSSTSNEPASRISPANLNRMVEAQGRIISVSPLVPIVAH